jgi:hypothetical protein
VPGVRQVSYVRHFPNLKLVGTAGAVESVRATVHTVGSDYFQLMGLPAVAGRTLTAVDRDRPGAMAVINQYMAEAVWPGRDPLGKTMIFRG